MLIGAKVLPDKEVWCGEHGPESGYPKFIFGSITASYGTWGETLLALTSTQGCCEDSNQSDFEFQRREKGFLLGFFFPQPEEKRIGNISWHKYHLNWVKA